MRLLLTFIRSSMHLLSGRPMLQLRVRGTHLRTFLLHGKSVLRAMRPAHCDFNFLKRRALLVTFARLPISQFLMYCGIGIETKTMGWFQPIHHHAGSSVRYPNTKGGVHIIDLLCCYLFRRGRYNKTRRVPITRAEEKYRLRRH